MAAGSGLMNKQILFRDDQKFLAMLPDSMIVCDGCFKDYKKALNAPKIEWEWI